MRLSRPLPIFSLCLVFDLGHGILPTVSPKARIYLVECVQTFTEIEYALDTKRAAPKGPPSLITDRATIGYYPCRSLNLITV
jgi:hypothetical protein